MHSFGELNGVTASSLLLLGDKSLDFLKACNKRIDELNLSSMSQELTYLKTMRLNIEDILKSHGFRIDNVQNPEEVKCDLMSSLALIIKNRTGLESNFGNKTNFFSEEEDMFGGLFEEEPDSGNEEDLFGDAFGDSEFESSVSEEISTLDDSINLVNLLEFLKSPEYLQNSLDVSEIDVNNLLDEISLFRDKYSVFEVRCKNDSESPINESKGMKRILSSGRGNPEIIDFITKSYNRISLFHLTFSELNTLIKDMEEAKLFEDSSSRNINTDKFSDKSIVIGDNLAYLLYMNMNRLSGQSDLVSKLIAFCDVKSTKSTNQSKILGIPLNLCYLKFKGTNYRSFCENLELAVKQIPDRTLETYRLTIKNLTESIKIISDYISAITFNRSNDTDYEVFKTFVKSYITHSEIKEHRKDMFDFMKELDSKKLVPKVKELLSINEKIDDAVDAYTSEIYDTFKLYRLSSQFSIDNYNSLLPQEVLDNVGVLDIDTLIEVNLYLRDVYKIIPLTLSHFVRNKIMATSKTNKVIDKDVYSDVKPAVDLLLENYQSKYAMSTIESYSGTLVIS